MHCIITNFLQIRKDDVDNYNGGIAVPACQLTVKPQVPDSTPAISYRFTIEGTDTKTVLFEMGKFSVHVHMGQLMTSCVLQTHRETSIPTWAWVQKR